MPPATAPMPAPVAAALLLSPIKAPSPAPTAAPAPAPIAVFPPVPISFMFAQPATRAITLIHVASRPVRMEIFIEFSLFVSDSVEAAASHATKQGRPRVLPFGSAQAGLTFVDTAMKRKIPERARRSGIEAASARRIAPG